MSINHLCKNAEEYSKKSGCLTSINDLTLVNMLTLQNALFHIGSVSAATKKNYQDTRCLSTTLDTKYGERLLMRVPNLETMRVARSNVSVTGCNKKSPGITLYHQSFNAGNTTTCNILKTLLTS